MSKIPPQIISEEDVPMSPHGGIELGENPNNNLGKVKDIENFFDWKKFGLGATTLGWCIALMFGCILVSLWNPDNELVSQGFEAFRIIIMTILGYLFGSSRKN